FYSITNRLLYQLSYVGFWFAFFSLPNRLVVLAVQLLYKRSEAQAVHGCGHDWRYSFDVAPLFVRVGRGDHGNFRQQLRGHWRCA
ncbi:MAG: hypothetical protein WB762_24720, partial [Candidatus Sulfotelmatobacter sp.]